MSPRLADRRSRPRFEIVGQLWATVEMTVALPLLNVSRDGALIESDVPLPADSQHDVRVSCDGTDEPARIRVCHTRPNTAPGATSAYLIGVEFVSVSPVLRARIDRWLEAGNAAVEV